MKISYNWLKQHLNYLPAPETLSALLTDCGLEVESMHEVSAVKGGLKGVVVGHVVEREKHPDADRLSLTKVDTGSGTLLDIVCGAPNVAAGQKVLVATVGTTIHLKDSSFDIKKSKIRGYTSEGMICAEDELGLGHSHEGIMVLSPDAPVGMEAATFLCLENDTVFEIGLTPNRADATSHLGVARDIFALLKNRDLLPEEKKAEIELLSDNFTISEPPAPTRAISVEVADNEACIRYSGITITGVNVTTSPDWLRKRLEAIGLKPINNIVDISNYVLFDLGQPLHIFDADAIKGDKVVIRKYPQAFEFVTLDGHKRALGTDDLMICNAEAPMCIAGVYGGLNSGVSEKTKDIFIESACFSPVSIRKTSKRTGLKTDASFRFERGTDPDITLKALSKAVQLITDIAGGQVASPIEDVYPYPVVRNLIPFSVDAFCRMAGQNIPVETIKNILRSLEIDIISEEGDILNVTVPAYRVDVTRAIDITEDVLRIYGYNNIAIPEQIKASPSFSLQPDKEKITDTLSAYLSHNGYAEIMNNSLSKTDYYEKLPFFAPDKSVKLLNALSKDLETMRQTLLYSGLETIAYNNNRKSFNLKLYEFGKTYSLNAEASELGKYEEAYNFAIFLTGLSANESWKGKPAAFDFFHLKSDVLALLASVGIKESMLKVSETSETYFEYGITYSFRKKPLFHAGLLKPVLKNHFDIKQNVFFAVIDMALLWETCGNIKLSYSEVARFPAMRRDLALLINENISFGELENAARTINNPILKDIGLFDIYRGDKLEAGKKSYALSFTLQDDKRTLTDEEADAIMKKLSSLFESKFGAQIR